MGLIARIVIGVALAGVGTYFVIRTNSILGIFGRVNWAETKIGPGGTYLFYKIMGIIFILIGFIVATNLWNAFLEATLGSIIPKPTAE